MVSLALGLLGFLAYLLYDVNSVTRKDPWMHRLFAVGSVLLLILTGDVIVSVIVNALIVAAFAYVAHRVSHDPIA